MSKPKVIILYNKIFHYRIPVWNELAKMCDLTVSYSEGDGKVPEGMEVLFDIKYLLARRFKGLVIQKANIRKLCRNYDAVIGAGAIVTKDIPPYAVVAGVQDKIIRYRFAEEQIQTFKEVKWWNKRDKELRNNISLFQEPVDKELIMKLKGVIRGYLVDYQLNTQRWHLFCERRCAA